MDVRAERWLAPHAGESKGRTAPHGTGGNVSGAVRPLHALGVERQLRAPAGPRERGTCGSVAARARATRGVSVVPPNKAMKLTKLSAALWHGRHEELVGRCRLVPAVAWLRAGTASQLIASVRWTQGRPRRTRRTRPVRRAEGARGVLLEQCMDLRAERWLAPLAGESKGRTAPHGTGGNASGAVRPLHALGVERQLRAPAGPRERGTYCSGTRSVRTDPGREWGATEQGVQADEAPLEAGRDMVVGRGRGSVVTVWVPASSGASQLNAGVRWTQGRWSSGTD